MSMISNRLAFSFTARMVLTFGLLGLVTLFTASFFSVRYSQYQTETEIESTLQQRLNNVQNLIENRLDILSTHLDSNVSKRFFTSLAMNELDDELIDEEVFQDSDRLGALDYFFVLNPEGELIFDASVPFYDLKDVLANMRSPIIYSSGWHLVGEGKNITLIRSSPIFDPLTTLLKGYMVSGLALGKNETFMELLLQKSNLDYLAIIDNQANAILSARRDNRNLLAVTDGVSKSQNNDQFHLREQLFLFDKPFELTLEIALSRDRFQELAGQFNRAFILLTIAFVISLILAGWILHLSRRRALAELLSFIESTKQGLKGINFKTTGITEYNRVGDAMQEMVKDLNIAATVFESGEGIVIADKDKKIIRSNKAFTDITGFAAKDIQGKTLDALTVKNNNTSYNDIDTILLNSGSWRTEVWAERKNGDTYLQWTSISAVLSEYNQSINHYVVTLLDITQQKESEQRIRQLSYYDQLTLLPNRQLLMDKLIQALNNSARSGQVGALLSLDLDDFKTLNDTKGHNMGDLLLQNLATRLTQQVRNSDTLARTGGDEFIILMENINIEEQTAITVLERISRKILDTVSTPFHIENEDYYCTLSLGITLYRGKKNSVEELLKQVDLAMYQAKAEGKNTFKFFNTSMEKHANRQATLSHELRAAHLNNQLTLVYQPQFNDQGHIIGAEALLRWQHDSLGFISPADFIPIAEDTGLIHPIGKWVLEQTCKLLTTWQNNPIVAHLTMAVNISPKQFQADNFVEMVIASIEDSHCNPEGLKLEITESMLLHDVEGTILKMETLKKLGVKFSLDDFGTGYSSLAYLKKLKMDQLKIDRSFIWDMLNDKQQADIVKTIIFLGKNLQLEVIAEGVETEEQRQLLAEFGCNEYQGYLFSKPIGEAEFNQLYL